MGRSVRQRVIRVTNLAKDNLEVSAPVHLIPLIFGGHFDLLGPRKVENKGETLLNKNTGMESARVRKLVLQGERGRTCDIQSFTHDSHSRPPTTLGHRPHSQLTPHSSLLITTPRLLLP